jgi:hypothetical protein
LRFDIITWRDSAGSGHEDGDGDGDEKAVEGEERKKNGKSIDRNE